MKITKDNFEKEVLESKVPVLVDFYADWCGPCKMMTPIVDALAKEAGDAYKVCKLNIDEDTPVAIKYGVMSIPTFIVFKDGEVQSKTVGATSAEDLREKLNL